MKNFLISLVVAGWIHASYGQEIIEPETQEQTQEQELFSQDSVTPSSSFSEITTPVTMTPLPAITAQATDTLWGPTSIQAIQEQITLIQPRQSSRLLFELLSRILLSSSFQGKDDLEALRLEKLWQLGWEDVVDKALPLEATPSKSFQPLMFNRALLSATPIKGCSLVPLSATEQLTCALLKQDKSQAAVTLELLQETDTADDLVTLASFILNHTAKAPALQTLSPTLWVLMKQAKLKPSLQQLEKASPLLLRSLVDTTHLTTAVWLEALYQAVHVQALTPEEGLSLIQQRALKEEPASLLLKAYQEKKPARKAELLHALWQKITTSPHQKELWLLSVPIAQQLPIAADLAWIASDIVKALLLAHDEEKALAWATMLKDNSPEEALELQPLMLFSRFGEKYVWNPAIQQAWEKTIMRLRKKDALTLIECVRHLMAPSIPAASPMDAEPLLLGPAILKIAQSLQSKPPREWPVDQVMGYAQELRALGLIEEANRLIIEMLLDRWFA